MPRKGQSKRVSARQRALGKLRPGQVAIFKVKERTRKAAVGRERVGFSAQFVVNASFSVLMDTRLLVRLMQVRLGEHYQDALAGQFDPNTGRPLPRPTTTRKTSSGERIPIPRPKRSRKLGIRTGKMLNSWQIGRISGKVSRARGIVQPFMQGGTGTLKYQRRFFFEYFLGLRTYSVTDPKKQQRDARGRFVRGGAVKGPGPVYEHAPLDFQHVDGLAAIVIRDALDEFINDSGLKSEGPLLPPPSYLGAGKLSRVRDASGF